MPVSFSHVFPLVLFRSPFETILTLKTLTLTQTHSIIVEKEGAFEVGHEVSIEEILDHLTIHME
jgi:hypothetical protein